MVRILLSLTLAATAVAAPVLAQSKDGKPLAFDVASVRQNKSGGKQEAGATADGYRMKNMSLLLAVLTAYVPTAGGATYYTNNQIQGVPEWVKAERYDIDAKLPDADLADWQKKPLQEEMLRSMLQSLLAERCKLTVHREMKDVATFSLVIGKHGPKLQEAKPDVPHPGGSRCREARCWCRRTTGKHSTFMGRRWFRWHRC